MDHLQHELKKEFQLERLILFTDAVFAIAITLLAIEIKVPSLHDMINETNIDTALSNRLGEMTPIFIGFFISFFVIAQYWMIHHKLFGYLDDYSPKLLWANMLFLLGVILLPFSSAFFSEYFIFNSNIANGIYFLNILFLALMNTRLWYIISKKENKLSKLNEHPLLVKYYINRSFFVPSIFFIAFLLSNYWIWLKALTLMIMPFYGVLYRRYYKKKYNFDPNLLKS
jgi:uncharacterized membrane protein